MQKRIIKAGESGRFQIVVAYTEFLKEEGKHKAVLLVRDAKKRNNGSEIIIKSEVREIIESQIKDMASVFAPAHDVTILDLQEVGKHDK